MKFQHAIVSRRVARAGAFAVALLLTACSVTATATPSHQTTPTSTTSPVNAGIVQLRPVIPPKGAVAPSCPVGESLSTCSGTLDTMTWKRPSAQCPKKPPSINPAPDRAAHVLYVGTSASGCFDLAPASFVVTQAASVKTDLQPLNGNPGIEITVPPSQVSALDAAIAKSFKLPLAIVAEGQIIEIVDPEPTNAQYQSMGGVLIFYASSPKIAVVVKQLRP